jgi:hypothetical protein
VEDGTNEFREGDSKEIAGLAEVWHHCAVSPCRGDGDVANVHDGDHNVEEVKLFSRGEVYDV